MRSPSPGSAAAGPLRGAGGVVVRAVEPHEDELADACGRLVADVYGGEQLIGDDADYLAHIVADARRRARLATVLVALDDPGPAGQADDPTAPREPVSTPGTPQSPHAWPGRLLGTTTYVPVGALHSELAKPGEAEMRMLAVAADARGRGVGRLLTLACVERARRAGYQRFVLSTAPLMTAAHELYRSLGMTRSPQRDWSPTSDVCLLTFELSLASAGET